MTPPSIIITIPSPKTSHIMDVSLEDERATHPEGSRPPSADEGMAETRPWWLETSWPVQVYLMASLLYLVSYMVILLTCAWPTCSVLAFVMTVLYVVTALNLCLCELLLTD